MRHECWTSQGSLSCSLWKSVCHNWTASDGTHNCMPGCESILAVTGSWLIFVCGFCLCGIRSWNSHVWWFLGMKELLNLLQRCCVGRTGPIPWTGGVMWFYPTRPCFLRLCHRTHLYSTICHSPDGKTHWNWMRFETCSLLGLYATYNGNSIPTFWDNQSVPSSRFKISKRNLSW
jgi:hypothetical protein